MPQATCATVWKGPCATEAPPSPPSPPAPPPIAPCADWLHVVGHGKSYCSGSPCSCDYVFSKWRGSDSILTYCEYVIEERLGHLFDESDAMRSERIYTVCPGTCMGSNVGPCANEPRPPPPPALPPFPPCSDTLHVLSASNPSCWDDLTGTEQVCTCEYVINRWRGQTSVLDYCLAKVVDQFLHIFDQTQQAAMQEQDTLIYSLCEASCAQHGVGACAGNEQDDCSQFSDGSLGLEGGNALSVLGLADESCASMIPALVAGYNAKESTLATVTVFFACWSWVPEQFLSEVPFTWPNPSVGPLRHICGQTCCLSGAPPYALAPSPEPSTSPEPSPSPEPSLSPGPSPWGTDSSGGFSGMEAWQMHCCITDLDGRRLLNVEEGAAQQQQRLSFASAMKQANRAYFKANPEAARKHAKAKRKREIRD